MVKSNVSELIALGMNETLDNEEFQALFGVAYKKAGHGCKEAHEHTSECGDASYADDNAVDAPPPPKPLPKFDPNFGATPVPGPDPNQPGMLSADDTSFADDDDNDADDADDDDNDAEDGDTEEDTRKEAALGTAIEGLLIVSAALDSVGFEKSATTTLNLAGLISEAKKKVEEKKKKKKEDKKKGKNPFAKGNGSSSSSKGSSSKSDSNDANDKAKAKAKKKKEEEAKAEAEAKAKLKAKKEKDTQSANDKKAKEAEKEKKAKEAEKAAAKKKKEQEAAAAAKKKK